MSYVVLKKYSVVKRGKYLFYKSFLNISHSSHNNI